MKIKKLNYSILCLLFLFSSCKEELKCDSLMANLGIRKELTKIHGKERAFFKLFEIDNPNYILRELFNTKTKIHTVKTLPNAATETCHCEARLSITYDDKTKAAILKKIDPQMHPLFNSYFDEFVSESSIEYEFSNPSKNIFNVKIIESNEEELVRSIMYFIRLHKYEQAAKK